ncbi:MAG TPA: hypothetical protein VLU23_19035 [Pseudolabrys sp.]|jgi:hypothetical protein|nr:hypothetical protein [Pseudolabrys sp.]
MNLLILVVDDKPDVEMLFRQQFRPSADMSQCSAHVRSRGEEQT